MNNEDTLLLLSVDYLDWFISFFCFCDSVSAGGSMLVLSASSGKYGDNPAQQT